MRQRRGILKRGESMRGGEWEICTSTFCSEIQLKKTDFLLLFLYLSFLVS